MTIKRTCGLLLSLAGAAWSQYVVGAQSGVIQFTAGEVFVDQQAVRATPRKFPAVQLGQVLRTGRGRAEMLLGQAVFLRLGQQSSVQMLSSRLTDTQLEVTRGKVLVEVVALNKDGRIQIRLGNTTTEFKRTGLYRFDLPPGEIRVFGGEAEVSSGDQKVDLTRGKSVRGDSDLMPQKFDLKKTDGLHEWSARRSFVTFIATPPLRRPLNWEILFDGSAVNRDFNRKYFPRGASRQFIINEQRSRERQPPPN
jgi:hypothetical protein